MHICVEDIELPWFWIKGPICNKQNLTVNEGNFYLKENAGNIIPAYINNDNPCKNNW